VIQYLVKTFRDVGEKTVGTVLDPFGSVGKLTAAFVVQNVEGAVAEHTVELIRIGVRMAGEIFAVTVTEETMVMLHSMLLFRDRQTAAFFGRQFVCNEIGRKERG
jgi:hypothetical protein